MEGYIIVFMIHPSFSIFKESYHQIISNRKILIILLFLIVKIKKVNNLVSSVHLNI